MKRLLIVEDEKNLGPPLLERFEAAGFHVSLAQNAAAAETLIREGEFDLALLDILLPDGNGFDLAQLLRKKSPKASFLFLTAMSDPYDRVKGFDLGAEDYVVKPFHFRELMHRVKKILARKSVPEKLSPVKIGRAIVDFEGLKISTPGARSAKRQSFRLTGKEGALLRLLHEQRGSVLSREEILKRLWKDSDSGNFRTIDNLVLKVRKWVEPKEGGAEVIRSVRGLGYQLEKP